ncbi:MAG: folylpolyglutamate synthase/dihydrofolate synthase family protein [Gemmatimonadaceae bacterium]
MPHPLAPSPSGVGPGADAAYRDALDALFRRTTGESKLGLERVGNFLGRLGNPHLAYPVFHVAGTNGKGSTVATLEAVLRGAGFKVGRYTSPHLVDFRERIVVNEVPMAPEAIVAFLREWDPEAAQLGNTFFEVTTAMALWYFALQRVDVALVEVGLGGRLDATNLVQPLAASVTQIGFDHTEYLGNTLAEIAFEKAGIFKRGAVAVIGDNRPETQAVLLKQAELHGVSTIQMIGRDFRVSDISINANGTSFTHEFGMTREQLRTSLTGEFQAGNAAVALAMLRCAGGQWAQAAENAERFLGNVHIAGRFHRVGKYLFDVAHNPDGAATVAANLISLNVPKPIVAVVSVLRDKDWRGILNALSATTEHIVLTNAPTAPESRAWSEQEAFDWAQSQGIRVSLQRNFDVALSTAAEMGKTVLITGSFHTVGDAMERLQVDPLAR